MAHSGGPESIVQSVPSAGLQALAGGAPEFLETMSNEDPWVALSLTPLVTLPSGLDGPRYVQIATRPTPASDGRALLTLLAVGFAGSLLLALLVGSRLSGLALHPLGQMAAASRRLAAGDLSARVPEPRTRDEVGALARAFNAMAEQLQAVFATQQAFVADASHELRTPLTALGGQLDVLRGLIGGRSEEADQLIDSMRRDITCAKPAQPNAGSYLVHLGTCTSRRGCYPWRVTSKFDWKSMAPSLCAAIRTGSIRFC
jgi:signal transduction histidine kinase